MSEFRFFYPVSLAVSSGLFLIAAVITYCLADPFAGLFSAFGAILPSATQFALSSAPIWLSLTFICAIFCVLSVKIHQQADRMLLIIKASTLPLLLAALTAIPLVVVYLYLPIARLG